MPEDPRHMATQAEAQWLSEIKDNSKALDRIMRTFSAVQVGSGAPTATTKPDGTMYLDKTNLRLYVYAGGWHYTTLT